jgi:molybdopterin-guanine dinucleotide biosynthesis protein A
MGRSELTGIILAGGLSRRMGREKGLVEFHGKPLIQYGIDLLSQFTDQILISTGNAAYLDFGLELVTDEISGQGPAAGLAASLKFSTTPWNLVLACDLPFLEPELIHNLFTKTGNTMAVIPAHDGVYEPLAALYHKDLAPVFEASVYSGNLALHKILATCKVHYLNAAPLMKKYPQLFTNFNSLKEMESP